MNAVIRRVGWLLIGLAASSIGCGSGSGQPGIDTFYKNLADLEVQQRVCSGRTQASAAAQLACDRTLPAEPDLAANAQSYLSADHLSFSSSKARACLAAVAAQLVGCLSASALPASDLPDPLDLAFDGSERSNLQPAACDGIFTGKLAAGTSCEDSRECAGGLFCDGTCKPLRQNLESCNNSSLCAIGLRCIGPEDFHCQPVGKEGDVCSGSTCGAGLECTGGTCHSLVAPGGACSNDAGCPTGFQCQGSSCEPRLTGCIGRGIVGSGHECAGNLACAGWKLNDFTIANATFGTCVVPQDAGGPCMPGFSGADAGCFSDLLCDPATSRCVAPGKAGQACVQGQCDPYSGWCDSNKTCQPFVTDGAACDPLGAQCNYGSRCQSGVCARDFPGDQFLCP